MIKPNLTNKVFICSAIALGMTASLVNISALAQPSPIISIIIAQASSSMPMTPEQMRQQHQKMIEDMQKMLQQMQEHMAKMTPEQMQQMSQHHQQMTQEMQHSIEQMQEMQQMMGIGTGMGTMNHHPKPQQ
ncbi:hypothetical protein [Aphanothece sacrum]|nr:hypothetical protein [Aphanothece sacrum]GBF87251.1 membrane protein [Aphanothece sacrum FPU3]